MTGIAADLQLAMVGAVEGVGVGMADGQLMEVHGPVDAGGAL